MKWDRAVMSIARELERANRQSIRTAQREAKLQQAADAESMYEQYLDEEASRFDLHRTCAPTMDWSGKAEAPPPAEPQALNYVAAAKARRASYRPSLIAGWLGLDKKQAARLDEAIQQAEGDEAEENHRRTEEYKLAYSAWEQERDFAKRVLEQDPHSYLEIIKASTHLEGVPIGTNVDVNFKDGRAALLALSLIPQSKLPTEEYRLLKSGRISSKELSDTRFNERYLVHVCSAALRITAEILAILPVEAALVNGQCELLDRSTGNTSEATIISLIVPRETAAGLQYSLLDPVEAMRMNA